MFKPFAKMFENVSEACKKAKMTFTLGFRQGAIKAYAETQKKELQKATPRSKESGKHAADDWELDYDREMGLVAGFEISNPHDRIDWLEYGTDYWKPIVPVNKKALKFNIGGATIFATKAYRDGIEPMGFVREVQDKMNRNIPSWLRKAFDNPIERDFK
ncbi:MAG: hypothetical protein KAR20_28075 [Candidatus Heimdallarchaeota archaeon]|nr:hypothetical protein [Candidatus Heimdallarchaeota archaeon]